MARQTQTESKPLQALRRVALRYPKAEEGVACKGTALECSTFKARKKAFLFVGGAVRVKLRESLAEAARLAKKDPACYKVGANGWVAVTFSHDQSPPPGLLERWIDESYRLLVPKQLVAMLPERGLPTGDSTTTAKKKAPKKKAPSR